MTASITSAMSDMVSHTGRTVLDGDELDNAMNLPTSPNQTAKTLHSPSLSKPGASSSPSRTATTTRMRCAATRPALPGRASSSYGFAWAAGFFDANRALISELAGLLLANGGRLTHDEMVASTGGRLRGADQLVMVGMLSRLSSFAQAIDTIQAHVQALQAREFHR
jgi:hypothetical protein